MDPWGLVPLPGAVAFLAAAVAAASGRGAPRGRTALALTGVASGFLLGALSWTLFVGRAPTSMLLLGAANLTLVLSLPLWIALSLRFGSAPGQSGGQAFLVPLALLVDIGLLLAGAFGPESARIEIQRPHAALYLEGSAPRLAAGATLLVGAFGVLRAQALWEIARRERLESLRRAFSGLSLAFLLIFLFAAQTLLYGAASLKVFAVGSLVFIPALGVIAPILRSGSTAALPAGTRPSSSSAVLLGLGAFLILLAAIGELVSRLAPAGRVLWFQWGGSILVGGFAALWLIPGARRRLRRWLLVPEVSRRYAWDPWSLLRSAQPASSGPALLLLGSLFDNIKGRPAMALWVRTAGDSFAPWAKPTSPLPRLEASNPLVAVLRRDHAALDLTEPPGRLALVPAYVENLELVEQMGFRLYLALLAGDEEFAVLALAPRDRAASVLPSVVLDVYGGELAVLTWGLLVAWNEPDADEDEAVLAGRYAEAQDLLLRAAGSAAERTIVPDFGARLSSAAEEAARLLGTRARQLRRESSPSAPSPSLHADPAAGGASR